MKSYSDKVKLLSLSFLALAVILFPGVTTRADSGLIGYWNFDEADGLTYSDSSSNNNDGTVTGAGVSHSTDVPPVSCFNDPYSVSFDSSGDYVSIPDNATMDPTDQISIVFWMKANNVSNGYQHIVFKQGPVVTSYGVWLSDNHVYMEDNDNTVRSLTSNATINTDTWYFIAVTYDGDTQKLYINSDLDNSQPLPGITLTYENSPVKIGSGDYNNAFDGYVDDLRIYSTALTATQVADLAGGGCGPGVEPQTTANTTVTNNTTAESTSTAAISSLPVTGHNAPSDKPYYLYVLLSFALLVLSTIPIRRLYSGGRRLR